MHYLIGNWKSNGSRDLLDSFCSQWPDFPHEIQLGLALPFPLLAQGLAKAWCGAQNVSAYGPGAFTGEVHAGMLAEMSVDFCLVGHSERRHLMGETIEQTAQKLAALSTESILPVFCVGETLTEREAGQLEAVLAAQLAPVKNFDRPILIAYEPVWAIGTGVAATPEDADRAHRWIRSWFETNRRIAPPILYGGSVNPDNARQLANKPSIHGFLVGGASLKPHSFFEIGSKLVG